MDTSRIIHDFFTKETFFCSNEMRIKIFHVENLFLVSIFKGFSPSGFFNMIYDLIHNKNYFSG